MLFTMYVKCFSLVQIAGDALPDDESAASVGAARQRRASESDSLIDLQRSTPACNMGNGTGVPGNNVDILQMLSKAQDEYDKVSVQKHCRGIVCTYFAFLLLLLLLLGSWRSTARVRQLNWLVTTVYGIIRWWKLYWWISGLQRMETDNARFSVSISGRSFWQLYILITWQSAPTIRRSVSDIMESQQLFLIIMIIIIFSVDRHSLINLQTPHFRKKRLVKAIKISWRPVMKWFSKTQCSKYLCISISFFRFLTVLCDMNYVMQTKGQNTSQPSSNGATTNCPTKVLSDEGFFIGDVVYISI